MTTTKGFHASARLPPQLRTAMFARHLRHSRRFATQNRAPRLLKGLDFGAHARQNCLEILESQTVKFAVSCTPSDNCLLRQLDGVGRSEGWTAVLSHSVFPELTTQRQMFLYSGSMGRVASELPDGTQFNPSPRSPVL
jgi:hypothetical protein